jgi:hypothetical protein
MCIPTSPIRHPPSPVCNLYLQSETAIIDKPCIAGKIVNFHCVPDEQRWRIAGPIAGPMFSVNLELQTHLRLELPLTRLRCDVSKCQIRAVEVQVWIRHLRVVENVDRIDAQPEGPPLIDSE